MLKRLFGGIGGNREQPTPHPQSTERITYALYREPDYYAGLPNMSHAANDYNPDEYCNGCYCLLGACDCDCEQCNESEEEQC